MFAVNPFMALVNEPVPVPSVVRVLAIVGPVLVFQHTPRAVIAAPPSELILPPAAAEEEVMVFIAVVVRVGSEGPPDGVVKAISEPYPVPALFVA